MRQNPLVPAAAIFLAGVTAGSQVAVSPMRALAAVAAMLAVWGLVEVACRRASGLMQVLATHVPLAMAIFLSGFALWQVNQHAVEANQVARFADPAAAIPIAARVRVIAPPDIKASHGNLLWLASVSSVYDGRDWIASSGVVRIKSRIGEGAMELHRGQLLEIYGWLERPPTAKNPGAMNLREFLAADRIFAQVRIPRPAGIIALDQERIAEHPLAALRLWLKEKLLSHTTRYDVEAGYSMLALLLGRREPIIDPINHAFADAGVSHLLAISGSHIVFFAGLVWAVLRFVPMRPRWREVLIAAIVMGYVLATPCGPAVVRAAVALLLLVIARLLNRPRMLMNMLAAAAIVVVILRPADLFDAGFQLSFVSTAALVLLAERLHAFLAGTWMERQRALADLGGTKWGRWKFRGVQVALAALTANIIGAASAAPLVAYHFGRVNLHAAFTGIVAIPFVGMTMIASAVQLLVELVLPPLAMMTAPVAAFVARMMVWIVTLLASLPGAALAVRSPPAWLVAILYGAFVLWAVRKWLPIARATCVNAMLAIVAVAAGWYVMTQPRGELVVTALSVGQGSSVVIRAPAGGVYVVNAGSRDAPGLVDNALAPVLRVAGVKQIDAMFLTSFSATAARHAPDAVDRFQPQVLFTSPYDWQHPDWTLPGDELVDLAAIRGMRHDSLTSSTRIETRSAQRMRMLWPESDRDVTPMALLLEYADRRILLLDPSTSLPPDLFPARLDALVLLSPQPSTMPPSLQLLIEHCAPETIVWSGRMPRAPLVNPSNTLTTREGALTFRIGADGVVSVSRP